MKYGLARRINLYNIETNVGGEVFSPAGDYIQSQLWCNRHLDGLPDDIADLYQTYVWAWHAARRAGELDRYGLPAELTRETLDEITNTVTVYLDVVEEDSLPLAGSPTEGGR